MEKSVVISDIVFTKSTFSKDDRYCVGVHISQNEVLVTNTKKKDGKICAFTVKEWEAFIAGVKNNEFDIR